MSEELKSLSARSRAELEQVQRSAQRAQQLYEKARRAGDEDFLQAAALDLQALYSGIENIFETIAREIDGALPSGPDWHRDLLLQMSADMRDRRPRVMRAETLVCVDEYRRFRHVVRNVYTFNIRPQRVRELVEELPECMNLVAADIESFCAFLEMPES